jgi:hypothetical protein
LTIKDVGVPDNGFMEVPKHVAVFLTKYVCVPDNCFMEVPKHVAVF